MMFKQTDRDKVQATQQPPARPVKPAQVQPQPSHSTQQLFPSAHRPETQCERGREGGQKTMPLEDWGEERKGKDSHSAHV